MSSFLKIELSVHRRARACATWQHTRRDLPSQYQTMIEIECFMDGMVLVIPRAFLSNSPGPVEVEDFFGKVFLMKMKMKSFSILFSYSISFLFDTNLFK